MIAQLRGRVLEKGEGVLVVDVGGVGLAVYVPQALAVETQREEVVHLFTHFHVRENELALYGFEEQAARDLFRLLLNVSGVGPRAAMALISALGVTAVQQAILQEEPALLSRAPGVGKKTAQKIVLELKDKVPAPAELVTASTTVHAVDAEVIDALLALGYSVVEAQRAVQGLPEDVTDVGERLRLALSRLAP